MPERDPPAFDEVGEDFISHYDSVRGYVRQEVTRRNLLPHLPSDGEKAADVGGGDGRDSEWLAQIGYTVTMSDHSDKMLEKASERDGGINCIKGDVSTLLEQGGKGQYDLVLSHGVLMYDLDDPEGHVKNLVSLLRPGGTLSLLTKSYWGAYDRLRRKQGPGWRQDINQLRRTNQVRENNLKQTTWAYDSRILTSMLHRAGLEAVSWYGVRMITDDDYRPWRDLDHVELATLVADEHRRGHDARLKENGQMLHFIARKPLENSPV